MNSKISLFILGVLLSSVANANDYRTLERVDYVLTCMRLAGGQTIDNLYACSCEIDQIAQTVEFNDFTAARTYEMYERMPGEKGGLFRESPDGDELRERLDEARQEAKKRCFIGVIRKQNTDSTTPTK